MSLGINSKYTKERLERSGIRILKERGDESLIHCVFSSCDHDSIGTEAHLFVNFERGVFHCFKCKAEGHISELFKHINL